MSVSDTTTIDAFGTDGSVGVLSIYDHLDWSDEIAHLQVLQAKISSYFGFIESRQYESVFPQKEISSFIIEVSFLHGVTDTAHRFLSAMTRKVNGKEVTLTVSPSSGSSAGEGPRSSVSHEVTVINSLVVGESGEAVLTLFDDLNWDDTDGHLRTLAKRIEGCLEFAQSEEIHKHCPGAGHFSEFIIEVSFVHGITESAYELLQSYSRRAESLGAVIQICVPGVENG